MIPNIVCISNDSKTSCWVVYDSEESLILEKDGVWRHGQRWEKPDPWQYDTEEEARQTLKDWFDTQSPEVFAEYVAQRIKGDG